MAGAESATAPNKGGESFNNEQREDDFILPEPKKKTENQPKKSEKEPKKTESQPPKSAKKASHNEISTDFSFDDDSVFQ
jgi:hypothetical protein